MDGYRHRDYRKKEKTNDLIENEMLSIFTVSKKTNKSIERFIDT